MKTELQKALAKIAPSISIRTLWEHDQDCRDIRKDVCDMEDEDPDNWQAWQSNVCATAIIDGEEIEGNAYLGGTWEKAGDLPEYSNPEISGYENQMTIEALEELAGLTSGDDLAEEIAAAILHCQEQARISYEAQRAELQTA